MIRKHLASVAQLTTPIEAKLSPSEVINALVKSAGQTEAQAALLFASVEKEPGKGRVVEAVLRAQFLKGIAGQQGD